jgi:predicted DNA-binding transcriptional regulator AlpA
MSERALITISDAAKIICVSRATVYRMIQAGEYDLQISQGMKTKEDVPTAIRGYLGCRFPSMIRLGPRCVRLKKVDVEAWVASKSRLSE